MNYLKAAVALRSLIKNTNSVLIDKTEELRKNPNIMMLSSADGKAIEIRMEEFTNKFVINTLAELEGMQAFVMTDIASMDVKGQEITYILYKGYHKALEKGMVFYQMIDKETLIPKGELLFSNTEKNMFFTVDAPDGEESSCNAMETGIQTQDKKSIVFFIGHMDEERLLYDIERLIFDTANNVVKHAKMDFEFIIEIARYGNEPSSDLKKKVEAISQYSEKFIRQEYPNTSFRFSYADS